MKNYFQKAIDDFKAKDSIEVCSVMSVGPTADRLVVTWPNVKRAYMVPRNPDYPACDPERWDLLWEWVEIDLSHWARIAGVPLPEVRAVRHVLIANRVIFPDGTISEFARKYVQQKVKRQLGMNR